MCFDRIKGKLLWKYEIGEGTRQDDRSSFAAPSPVTDGELVYFFFSNGDLICYDFDGKQKVGAEHSEGLRDLRVQLDLRHESHAF